MKPPFLPESLFGRLLTALLVTIGGILLIVGALLWREWREWRQTVMVSDRLSTESMAEMIAEGLHGAALRDPPPDPRRVGTHPYNFIGVRFPLDTDLQDPLDVARRLEEQTKERLGPEYLVNVSQVSDWTQYHVSDARGRVHAFGVDWPAELDVVVTLPSGFQVTFRVLVPPTPIRLPMALLLELLLVTLALGAVLYWAARTITRPLRELETAAETVGRGARVRPLRESGARELRSVTRAFNAMQERLYRYLDGRTRVLAAMSHDLATPLTRLKLRMEALDDEQLRARCNGDLDEMERLISGALRLFKGVDHEEPLEAVRVEDLLAELSGQLVEIGWDVTVSGSTIAAINVRKDSLKRCLINLISNAVRYGKYANVIIADEGGDLVVRVQDEGPGIPEAMLEKVFEPFFRLEDSRNVDTGGTGLGLSIARDVAQAHRGSLVLRNRSPRGLEAMLRLPRSEAH